MFGITMIIVNWYCQQGLWLTLSGVPKSWLTYFDVDLNIKFCHILDQINKCCTSF